MSSTAYDLARAEATEEEIRRALSPDVRQALPAAIRAVRQELQPASEADEDAIVVALGRQIGLLKAGLAAEHKEDWINIELTELIGLPAAMVLEAMESVRRRARYEGDVIPFIYEIVEPQVAKLRTEIKYLERLEALAG